MTQNKPEVGKIYEGKVKNMLKFGAFVEILPGIDGLVHISNMAPVRVAQPEDILEVGAIIDVKCIEVTEDTLRLTMIDVEQLNEKVANRIRRAVDKGDAPLPERKPRGDFKGKPRRNFGDKPKGPRSDDKKGGRKFNDKPRSDRPRSDKPKGGFKGKPKKSFNKAK